MGSRERLAPRLTMDGMNATDLPSRHERPAVNPMDYVVRRLSSLVVSAGVIAGFTGAALVESAGLPGPVVLGAGLLAFVAAISVTSAFSVRRQGLHRGEDPQ
jgi:hypothetical protein